MCANFKPIARNRASLLQLSMPQFEFSEDIYPTQDAPLIFSNRGQIEWRCVGFGMLPRWAKDLKIARHTYNARTETVHQKPSFKHAWYRSQFALIPVETIFEPKYVETQNSAAKPEWHGIARADGLPFTVAALYENALINGQQVRSMSMLTINADQHPFMRQFHAPEDEKRSIIVIPPSHREAWLNWNYQEAPQFFFDMPDEYVSFPKQIATAKTAAAQSTQQLLF